MLLAYLYYSMLFAYLSRGIIMELENIMAHRIKEMRTSANLTQAQLGDFIGLSKQAINDIEQGRRQTTITKVIAIARQFNTTVEYLTGETDDPMRKFEMPFIEQPFWVEKMISFGQHLRNIRQSHNYTQKHIAEAIKITERNYQRYETDNQRPSFDMLIALADYFDVSLDYLVGRSDDPKRY